jgi:hypothetical protein
MSQTQHHTTLEVHIYEIICPKSADDFKPMSVNVNIQTNEMMNHVA